MVNSPVLVFAAGQRCGSTLVQRLLSSHPDVLIWGEHAGQLRPIISAVSRMKIWSEEDGSEGREAFAGASYQSFMANITPEPQQIDEACRQFMLTMFAEPAAASGKPVWGLKEVRYGFPEARALHGLFPDAAIIHVVRDPRDILRSLDTWERRYGWWTRSNTELAIKDWHRVAESFLHCNTRMSPPVLTLRYEDLVADPAAATELLGAHASLDVAQFDLDVFKRKIHLTGLDGERQRSTPTWYELSPSMRALLDDDDLKMVAAAYGYDL